MTEAEWLACAEPGPMLWFLYDQASERKLRLFACACCRRIWPLIRHESYRNIVEVAERLADGQAGWGQLREGLQLAYREAGDEGNDSARWAATRTAGHLWPLQHPYGSPDDVTHYHAADAVASASGPPSDFLRNERKEFHAQACLLRDLFGPLPFHPLALPSPVFHWNTCTVPRIAQAIYDGRAFDRLPVLADALEDAGCTDQAILSHCRSGGEHVRGCWVIDLLLGKG